MYAKFSIKDLEKLSGIKAHTLRIWEQRYGILKPERTDTNIRWYSNDELKSLLNICLLYNHGLKISKIAQLSQEEIIGKVNHIIDEQSTEVEQIDALVIAMIEIDEIKFDWIISNNILNKGFEHTYGKIIYPFLMKIGTMWQTGAINPAQEHFISSLIRQKLVAAIDNLKFSNTAPEKQFLLFLPDGELHELSLLYYSYWLRSKGYGVIYLGQSVPMDDLEKVVEIRKPDCLLSIFTNPIDSPETVAKEISAKFKGIPLLLSGLQVFNSKLKPTKDIKLFNSPEELSKLI